LKEVTFDIDANGILNVSAVVKSSGKHEKITITNDKGRLSKEDFERMVSEAEKYKEEGDKQKERINAKKSPESYCGFNVQSTTEDDNIKGKLGEGDQKKIQDKCKEAISWLDANQTSETDVYKDKEVEAVWWSTSRWKSSTFRKWFITWF
jgi:heat shock protein 1/8